MRSIIVLALGLFATQTVGVHLAANANAAADYYGIDQCSHNLAKHLIRDKFGGYYHVDYDKFAEHVRGLVGDTLERGEADKIVKDMESKADFDNDELDGTALAEMIEGMGNAEAKRIFKLSNVC